MFHRSPKILQAMQSSQMISLLAENIRGLLDRSPALDLAPAHRRCVVDAGPSALTRAVFFSAVTTATAFGSLWLSNQPGISSMGKLLALSLACTLAAAALFQPALMGALRK